MSKILWYVMVGALFADPSLVRAQSIGPFQMYRGHIIADGLQGVGFVNLQSEDPIILASGQRFRIFVDLEVKEVAENPCLEKAAGCHVSISVRGTTADGESTSTIPWDFTEQFIMKGTATISIPGYIPGELVSGLATISLSIQQGDAKVFLHIIPIQIL